MLLNGSSIMLKVCPSNDVDVPVLHTITPHFLSPELRSAGVLLLI